MRYGGGTAPGEAPGSDKCGPPIVRWGMLLGIALGVQTASLSVCSFLCNELCWGVQGSIALALVLSARVPPIE